MHKQPLPQLEKWRVRSGDFATDASFGMTGAWFVPMPGNVDRHSSYLKVISSEGEGWEHVSVSLPRRCPTWPEMCFVKDLFWNSDEAVVQYHPRASEYVNNVKYCLHLWRPTTLVLPEPPSGMVGIKALGEIG